MNLSLICLVGGLIYTINAAPKKWITIWAAITFFAGLVTAVTVAIITLFNMGALTGVPARDVFILQSILGFSSLGLMSISIASIRQWLAKLIPIDPASPTHLLALAFSIALAGLVGISASNAGEATSTATLAQIVVQQGGFIVVAVLGTGLFTRRNAKEVLGRLGFKRLSLKQFALAIAITISLVAFNTIVMFFDAGESQEALAYGFASVGAWVAFAILTGLGEEILFRGAIQPVLGLPLTTLLFAVTHFQYSLLGMATIFVMGLVLGIVRKRGNTTMSTVVHIAYNAIFAISFAFSG